MLLRKVTKYRSFLPRHQNIIPIMHPRLGKQILWTRPLAKLLADNRVEELSSPPAILNRLTVSVQTSRKKRLILDLRHINLHVFKQKFKCEG